MSQFTSYIMWGFPNIEQMFINALEAFFGMIAGALNSVAKWFIEILLIFLTDTPAPVSDGGSWTNNPADIFRGCAKHASGGHSCTEAWNASYNVYLKAQEYGLIFLVLGILMSQASIPIQKMRQKRTVSNSKIMERSLLGIIGIEIWWTVGSFILEISSALAEGIGQMGIQSYLNAFGAIGSGSLAFILVGIVLYTVAISTILMIALFWIFRYIALFMLMGIMPIIIGLWAWKVGPLDMVADRAGEIAGLFSPLAFASVPAALVIWSGSFFLDIAGSFTQGILQSQSVSGTAMSLLTSIVTLILALTLPIAAGLAPLAFFREKAPGRAIDRYGPQAIKQYKDNASDRVEKATERHRNVKRQASAARAAYQGQGPVKYTDDGVAQQAQSWDDAAAGGRAIHSLRSGGSKGKQIGKAATDVAGTAVFNPKDTGKAVGVMTQNKISDTKQSLSEATESTGTTYKDTLKKTTAKGYEAQYQFQEWKEEKSNMSSTEVLEEVQGKSASVQSTVGGAIEEAGEEAHSGIFKSDADATNPRLIDDEGNPIKTPDGYEEEYVTQDMKTEFQTDSEGNLVVDEQGVAQTPEPEIDESSQPTYITNEQGEKLTDDRGEPIEEKEAYRYETTSDGDFLLDDGKPVPKEAVRDGPDSDPLKAETDDGSNDEWVTPSRVQQGEYVTDDDLDEDVPDDRKVKVSVLDEKGRTVKTVIKNEDGNIMKRDKHRFTPNDSDSTSTGDEQ